MIQKISKKGNVNETLLRVMILSLWLFHEVVSRGKGGGSSGGSGGHSGGSGGSGGGSSGGGSGSYSGGSNHSNGSYGNGSSSGGKSVLFYIMIGTFSFLGSCLFIAMCCACFAERGRNDKEEEKFAFAKEDVEANVRTIGLGSPPEGLYKGNYVNHLGNHSVLFLNIKFNQHPDGGYNIIGTANDTDGMSEVTEGLVSDNGDAYFVEDFDGNLRLLTRGKFSGNSFRGKWETSGKTGNQYELDGPSMTEDIEAEANDDLKLDDITAYDGTSEEQAPAFPMKAYRRSLVINTPILFQIQQTSRFTSST